MKYYLIAGEASGDLHGSNLMKELKIRDPYSIFRFYGGDLMEKQGGKLVKHYREMAFMGFIDVIVNIRTIKRNMEICKHDIIQFAPDALILIDYPGFNLRIAGYAFKNNIKTFYYIAPKVWASRESRVEQIRKFVYKLFVIFPFEVDYFKQKGIEAEYVGNPLMDSLSEFKIKNTDPEKILSEISAENKPVIALLAGSRKYEISRCLPEMVKAATSFPGYKFVVAGISSIKPELYNEILKDTEIKIVYDRTYELLNVAYAAIVTSGTATLETALFKVPQVVIYKIGRLTYHIGKMFVNIRFFSLVNIIADRELVKELLQFNLASDIKKELKNILSDDVYREKITAGYEEIILKLGSEGSSKRIANRICDSIL